MKRNVTFRQKLALSFALLLSLLLLHGAISWFALQESENRFAELRDVDQAIELTLRAHMNEKDYLLTQDRRLAATVLEELASAQEKIEQIAAQTAMLDKETLTAMNRSLALYQMTFSQYGIYADQIRALHSELQQLGSDLGNMIEELHQSDSVPLAEINRLHHFLLLLRDQAAPLTPESSYVQEMLSIASALRYGPYDSDVRLTAHRIISDLETYRSVTAKIEELEARQRANEKDMKAAAETVQSLGQSIKDLQNEQLRLRQSGITRILLGVFFLSLAIAAWGTRSLSARLMKPLQDLVQITAALGQGNFKQRIDIQVDDEFKTLLLSVNHMAENIENLNAHMEELVAERTQALEEEKIRFEQLFKHSPEGILIFDKDLHVIDANNAFTLMFGYTLAEIIGHNLSDFFLVEDYVPGNQTSRIEALRRCKDGRLLPVSIVKYSFPEARGQTLYYAIYTDVSERRAAEERLEYLSLHDGLTHLKNRTFFEAEMKRLQAEQSRCSLLVCDVDGLKEINDRFGHSEGDRLLQDAAAVLTRAAGHHTVARIGGDEFVVFLPDTSAALLPTLLQNISDALAECNLHRDQALRISVGFAHRPDGSIAMEDLFRQADQLMYAQKKSRRT